MEVINLIGIIVAIVFINWSIYRGLGLPLANVIGTAIIILTSGLNFSATWNSAMDGGVTSMLGTYALTFLFGGILGLLYAESGAAASLGEAMLSVAERFKSVKVQRIVALYLFLLFRILLTVAGIDGMACIVPTVALCVAMYDRYNIPRRYLNAFLITGCTVSLFMPWVPCGPNLMVPIFIEGWTASTGWLPRIICVVLMAVIVVLVLDHLIAKGQAKGEKFEAGKLERFKIPPEQKKPHWATTLVPIVVVFVVYNIIGMDAWVAVAGGCIAAVLLFGHCLELLPGKGRFGTIIEKCNQGSVMISLYMALSMLPGCAISLVPAYSLITGAVETLCEMFPGAIIFGIIAVLLTLVGGSSTTIMCGFCNTIFIPAGMSYSSLAVMMFVGTSVLSGLPNSMYVVSQAEMTDCTMKESYGPVFITNVILPALMMIFVVAMVLVGIW